MWYCNDHRVQCLNLHTHKCFHTPDVGNIAHIGWEPRAKERQTSYGKFRWWYRSYLWAQWVLLVISGAAIQYWTNRGHVHHQSVNARHSVWWLFLHTSWWRCCAPWWLPHCPGLLHQSHLWLVLWAAAVNGVGEPWRHVVDLQVGSEHDFMDWWFGPSEALLSSRGRVIGPTFDLSVSDLNFGVVAFGELVCSL